MIRTGFYRGGTRCSQKAQNPSYMKFTLIDNPTVITTKSLPIKVTFASVSRSTIAVAMFKSDGTLASPVVSTSGLSTITSSINPPVLTRTIYILDNLKTIGLTKESQIKDLIPLASPDIKSITHSNTSGLQDVSGLVINLPALINTYIGEISALANLRSITYAAFNTAYESEFRDVFTSKTNSIHYISIPTVIPVFTSTANMFRGLMDLKVLPYINLGVCTDASGMYNMAGILSTMPESLRLDVGPYMTSMFNMLSSVACKELIINGYVKDATAIAVNNDKRQTNSRTQDRLGLLSQGTASLVILKFPRTVKDIWCAPCALSPPAIANLFDKLPKLINQTVTIHLAKETGAPYPDYTRSVSPIVRKIATDKGYILEMEDYDP